MNESSPAPDWTPFELFRGLAFLSTTINGTVVPGCIDSGAAITCIDVSLATSLGLSGGQVVAVQGIGGSDTAELYQGVTLEVAGRRLEQVMILSIDLAATEEQLGRRLPLILGQNLFDHAVVDLDYPNRRVALRDSESFEYDGGGQSVELFHTPDGLLAIELGLEEHAPARFMLDTGLIGSVAIHAEYPPIERLCASFESVTTKLGGGVGGMHESEMATLRFVSIGPYGLEGVPTSFDRPEAKAETSVDSGGVSGVVSGGGVVGIVGADVLSRFRLTFCKVEGRLYVEATEDLLSAPFKKDRLGLQTIPTESKNGLRVIHVSHGSPAAQAGWEVGQVVSAIDGVAIGPGNLERFLDWECVPAGTSLELTDDAGHERTLVAAEYF